MIYLTEAYAIDNNSILRILTQNKQINRSDPNYSYYAKLATWANENGRQQKLKNIDLNALSLSDKGLVEKRKLTTRYTTLGHLLNDLKNLMDQEGKYTPSSEISKLVQQTTLDILTQLSKPKVADTQEEEPDNKEPENENGSESENNADEPELYEGMDWTAEKARRLEAAEGEPSEMLDKFYDDYYSVEYAGKTKNSAGDSSIVAKLKSLDKILIQEFNALGYNPAVNPLAQFLKLLIEYKPDIFNKLTTNTYGAIHNAFIAKSITGNMLGNYNAGNILFCTDLYNRNGLDIVNYLSLWKKAYNKADGNNTAKNILAAKIVLKQPRAVGKTYGEKVDSLKKLQADAVVAPGDSDAKLRSTSEIQELYRYIFRADTAEEEEEEELVKKEVNSKTIINILDEAAKQNVMLDMIRLILGQKAYTNAYPEAAQKIKYWLEKRRYEPVQKNIDDSRRILSKYALTASTLNYIINALVNRINEPTENTN
jgi:hypothetical protein